MANLPATDEEIKSIIHDRKQILEWCIDAIEEDDNYDIEDRGLFAIALFKAVQELV